MYRRLKKITSVLMIFTLCSIIAFIILGCYLSQNSEEDQYKETKIEYIAQLNYQEQKNVEEMDLYSISNIYTITKNISNNSDYKYFCIEIKNDDEWNYLKNSLGVTDCNIELDFEHDYIISFCWEISKLEYRKVHRNSGGIAYGIVEREENSYSNNTIHIYEMEEKLILQSIRLAN